MLSLTNYLNTELSAIDLQRCYEKWTQAESQQSELHYQHSTILDNFDIPIYYNNDENYQYFCYCFGDFTPLISNHILSQQELLSLAQFLLKIYDQNKGYDRRLRKGDSLDIQNLRLFAQGEGFPILEKINFVKYHYPYYKIHAHSLAQYSLSILILRIMEHNLSYHYKNLRIIELNHCYNCYHNATFNVLKDEHVHINIGSWSSGMQLYSCSNCKSSNERLWGKFKVCLDCYIHRLCRTCGATVQDNCTQHVPYCALHKPLK
jgi:hypothetical protein